MKIENLKSQNRKNENHKLTKTNLKKCHFLAKSLYKRGFPKSTPKCTVSPWKWGLGPKVPKKCQKCQKWPKVKKRKNPKMAPRG